VRQSCFVLVITTACVLLAAADASAQDVRARYEKAALLTGPSARTLVSGDQVRPTWLSGDRFWYRNNTGAGSEFMLVDPVAATRRPAFDHARLAAALSVAADTAYVAQKLPFETFDFEQDGRAIRFRTDSTRAWTCDLVAWTCAAAGKPRKEAAGVV
jgi:hypothetical protein